MAFLAEVIPKVIYSLCQFLVCAVGELTLLWKEKEGKGQQAWFCPLLPSPAEQRGYFQSARAGLKGVKCGPEPGLKQLWISPFFN